ncbi:MAG: M3 family metallopeptidase [Opitutaceae bacterium]
MSVAAGADLMDFYDVIARFDPVLGLEVHVELSTATKMFCGCSTTFGGQPNTQVCPVCLGLPGSLPVLNRNAVESAIRIGLALNCDIVPWCRFARKNYFYPDMPKNYQISQYDEPIAVNGHLDVPLDDGWGDEELDLPPPPAAATAAGVAAVAAEAAAVAVEAAAVAEETIATAAAAAKAAGHEGKFLIALVNTSGQPPLTDLKNHAARAKLMAASLARGSRGGDYDNRAVVSAIAKKRAARAALLGYPHHAAYQLEEQTVGSVEVLNKLLAQLAPPAVANARKEAADMQAIVDAEKGGFTLGAADWDLYTEKVRAARYAFDESQLRPYYELNHVLIDGVFFAATKLYGITFKERHDLPVYEPTVRTFDVFNADGSALAIFFFDPYARSNKNGGAWANSYSSQSHLLGTRTVIGNHLNIPQPPAGQPTLLTHDEVRTAFHEFGHALHGMFSNVKYPRFSGTSVPRDFVEFPSQVNEMWASWPEILKNYAKHYQTGAPLPAELLAKVQAAAKFNQGFKTTEYLAATLLDQAWHQVRADEIPEADGVLAFEAAALKKYGVDFSAVPPRYRSTYFSHTFSGGYSAGYYSYIWSEVLDADTVDWIKQHGGLQRANGERFRAKLLSRGGTADALSLFRDFTGSEPDIKPLLTRRGLEAPAQK